jgi:enoyl-CoA hydratase
MEFKNINLKSEEGGVWVLTMNRPQALNALNLETIGELDQAIQFLMEKSPMEARALIITGSGEKAFVAGADIKEMVALSAEQAKTFAEKGQRVFRNLEMLRMPVIAAVNGFALGGGLELALSCDFIYASENAKFGLPEVSLGLMPGFGGCVRLARVVGLNKAREMTMTGDMISAAEAQQVGLVQKVLPATELMGQVMKTISTLSARGPLAVAAVKRVVLDGYDLAADGALALEAERFGKLFQLNDSREGMKAFVEKRKAQFQGN